MVKPPTLIKTPTVIAVAGTQPKQINEHIGRVNSGHDQLSIARMVSPRGWVEPGQAPEFDEYTLVLRDTLCVEYREAGNNTTSTIDVTQGQAIVTHASQWVRYSTPNEGGAKYIAACLPAFSPESVHRDPS